MEWDTERVHNQTAITECHVIGTCLYDGTRL